MGPSENSFKYHTYAAAAAQRPPSNRQNANQYQIICKVPFFNMLKKHTTIRENSPSLEAISTTSPLAKHDKGRGENNHPLKPSNWFEVDKVGLNKIMSRKGKEFVVNELIQNALDQNVTKVDVWLTVDPATQVATITVEDDDPDGFKDLAHAWTLFTPSTKKHNAEKRGRFNLGEKLVLALCQEAEIITTTGGVRFDDAGRTLLAKSRQQGSMFRGVFSLTLAEFDACCVAVERLILQPDAPVTTFNGKVLSHRTPIATCEASLPTEVANSEGSLAKVTRKAIVRIYRPKAGEVGTLYEMGIPVVETGDGFHADVAQKIPLNFERDNVSPAYLKSVRMHVLNCVHGVLTSEQTAAAWVNEAIESKGVSPEAVRAVIDKRFGKKSVVFDPSDREANKLAVAKGYTVVHGSQFTSKAWDQVRAASALLPAGRVTPSPKPFSKGGRALIVVPPEKWSRLEKQVIEKLKGLSLILIGEPITVVMANDRGWPFAGAYGRQLLYINKAKVSRQFFAGINEENLDLLIHELGHHYESDHLSDRYYQALTKLGAKLAMAVAANPGLLA